MPSRSGRSLREGRFRVTSRKLRPEAHLLASDFTLHPSPFTLPLRLQPELPLLADRFLGVDVENAAGVAELELLLAVDAYAEEAGERVDRDAAERRAAHGGVEEGAIALAHAAPAFNLFPP